LKAFTSFSEDCGYEPKLLKAVDDVDERIKGGQRCSRVKVKKLVATATGLGTR
jgi:hypothetical protein